MKYYIVDAFADSVYHENQAGVCLLEQEVSDELMQNIASENNLSETAFLLEKNGNKTAQTGCKAGFVGKSNRV